MLKNLPSLLGGPAAPPKRDFSSWIPAPKPYSKEELEANSVPDTAKRNRKVVVYGEELDDLLKKIPSSSKLDNEDGEETEGHEVGDAAGAAAAAAAASGGEEGAFTIINVEGSARGFVEAITPRPPMKVLVKSKEEGVEPQVRILPTNMRPEDIPSVAIVYGTTQTYPTDSTYEVVEDHLRRYLQRGNKLLICGGCWDLHLLERICKGKVEHPEAPKKKKGEPKPPTPAPISREAEGVVDKKGYTAPKWREETEKGDPWSSSRSGTASLSPAGKTFFQGFPKVPSSVNFKGTFLNRANAKDVLYADKKGKVAMTYHVTQWGSAVIHVIDYNAQVVDWVEPVLRIWAGEKGTTTAATGGGKAKKPAPKKTSAEKTSRGKRNRDAEDV